jgi:mannobiose 2-epimerase
MIDQTTWRRQLEDELTGNILPFWIRHAPDSVHGGFIGGMNNANEILDFPRSAVLTSRILWTFSFAARQDNRPEYRAMADRAHQTLRERFVDGTYGGLYGAVNAAGVPVHRRKLAYAQAFGIYGLSEYFALTQDPAVLELAIELFRYIEDHIADTDGGGYFEGVTEEGSADPFAQITDAEPEHRKSLNTLLHLLEAYTCLRNIWPHVHIQERHETLLKTILQRVIDQETGHFHLYFRADWSPLGHNLSYGHDIEGAWLLREAAHLTAHPAAADRAALGLAEGVLKRGFMEPGRLAFEGDRTEIHDRQLHWWVQAEAMVGFYDAYQISGSEAYLEASYACWQTIRELFIDRNGGDWFKVLDEKGTPFFRSLKIGPWECPYHHARACFEMIRRLG